MLKVEYNPQQELVVVTTSGTVSFEELIKGTEILNREDLPLDLRPLTMPPTLTTILRLTKFPLLLAIY